MVKTVLINLGKHREYEQIDEGLGLASVGLESIATHLKNNGEEVLVIDQAMNGLDSEEILKQIIEQKPDHIGLNPLINFRKESGKIARKVKERSPKTTIIIGGYDATFLSLDHPLYEFIDVIVRGKGEVPLLKLAQGRKLEEIQGIAYRTETKIIDNLEKRAESLLPENLPIPNRQNLEYLAERQEPVSIYASCGCIYNCEFCSTPRFYPEGRVERKLEDVLEEIDFLADNGIKKFSFYDEDFFGVNKAALERATKIIEKIKERVGTITFSFITTQGIHQAEKYDLLHKWEGTVNRLYVGVEGGCDKALKGLGNDSCKRSEKNSKAINIIRNYNLGLHIGFIMFNAYSTFEELNDSAQFLYAHNEAVNGISFFHHLRPYKGTAMYDKLKKEGLLKEKEALSEIDLHSSLPYNFKKDLDEGNEKIKSFAKAICPTSNEQEVSESDRLSNEIYMGIVNLGYGKEIFNDNEAPEIVEKYRDIRKDISNLNYEFFNDSLKLFRDCEGEGFVERKETYLVALGSYVSELKEIKKRVG
jgi:anaerobic magnesium-protoporphyrin IX monomethyl ester cyclase